MVGQSAAVGAGGKKCPHAFPQYRDNVHHVGRCWGISCCMARFDSIGTTDIYGNSHEVHAPPHAPDGHHPSDHPAQIGQHATAKTARAWHSRLRRC